MALSDRFYGVEQLLQISWKADGTKVAKVRVIIDMMTGGSSTKMRRITDGVIEGEYYPNHEAVDFITNTRAISR